MSRLCGIETVRFSSRRGVQNESWIRTSGNGTASSFTSVRSFGAVSATAATASSRRPHPNIITRPRGYNISSPLPVELPHSEAVDRGLVVGLAWLLDRGGELGMVGGVREVLRLQAEGVALLVDLLALALDRSVQEVAGVALHSRLGREDFHGPAARRIDRARREDQPRPLAVDHPVVGVALAKDELLVVLMD